MLITRLITDLKIEQVHWVLNQSPEEEVYNFRPYGHMNEFEQNFLYIGYLDKFPDIRSDLPLNFLCINNQQNRNKPFFETTHLPNSNIVVITSDLKYPDICDLASNLFLEESKYNRFNSELLLESSKNLGLDHLIQTAYSILRSPIIVSDTSYKILGSYLKPNDKEYSTLTDQIKLGYIDSSIITNPPSEGHIFSVKTTVPTSETNKEPLYNPLTPIGTQPTDNWLNALVHIQGIQVATISVLENNHSFNRYDLKYLNLFSQIVSFEMQKDESFTYNKLAIQNSLLLELLEERIQQPNVITLRMEQLGWLESPYYYIFTIFDKNESLEKRIKIIINQLSACIDHFKYSLYDKKLVLILPKNMADDPIFKSPNKVIKFLENNHLNGITSSKFSKMQDIKYNYQQTITLRHILDRIEKKDILSYNDDYLFDRLRYVLQKNSRISDFYHPKIQEIIEYDQLNNTKFIDTLHIFLLHMDNPKLCAELLFIHKNTFYYRMNKMKELFDLDISDGMERLKLHLTLELIKY